MIASGKAGFDLAGGFASNGYAAHSPGGYSMMACLVAEVVLTLMFLVIILGATDRRAPQGFAPIAIGLGLDADSPDRHSCDQPLGEPRAQHGASVFVGGWAVEQLWLFWLAPIVGAAIAGVLYPAVAGEPEPEPGESDCRALNGTLEIVRVDRRIHRRNVWKVNQS